MGGVRLLEGPWLPGVGAGAGAMALLHLEDSAGLPFGDMLLPSCWAVCCAHQRSLWESGGKNVEYFSDRAVLSFLLSMLLRLKAENWHSFPQH